jgi:hypothetical protein
MSEHFDKGDVMKEYPVGSVCVVIGAKYATEMIGKEVTITAPLRICHDPLADDFWMGYDTDAVCDNGFKYSPRHEYLKLKKLPPDVAFDKFLNNLKQPVEETV